MTRDEIRDRIATVLEAAGTAHHEAFIDTNGDDPEWPLWYARHLQEPLGELLGASFTVSSLTRIVQQLAEEHTAQDPDGPWPEHYAGQLVERFLAGAEEFLSLYHFEGCPYCSMVRRVIDELEAPVELRDINLHDEHWQALVDARGRATVPVLRCTQGDVDRWMPESRDIVEYLRARFGS